MRDEPSLEEGLNHVAPANPRLSQTVAYIGVDWGGTKIEAIALDEDGTRSPASRADTPRSDYAGCLAVIADARAARRGGGGHGGTVGIGLPGSLDPRTGIAKGASSTWLNGRRVEDDLRAALGRDVRTANDADCFAVSEATDGAGSGPPRRLRGDPRQRRRRRRSPSTAAPTTAPTTAPASGATTRCRCPTSPRSPVPPATAGGTAAWRRGSPGAAFARDYRRHAEVDLAEPVDLHAGGDHRAHARRRPARRAGLGPLRRPRRARARARRQHPRPRRAGDGRRHVERRRALRRPAAAARRPTRSRRCSTPRSCARGTATRAASAAPAWLWTDMSWYDAALRGAPS